ncbi:MAG: hypothetical protein AAF902_05735 [Chloroflexota bacterium]
MDQKTATYWNQFSVGDSVTVPGGVGTCGCGHKFTAPDTEAIYQGINRDYGIRSARLKYVENPACSNCGTEVETVDVYLFNDYDTVLKHDGISCPECHHVAQPDHRFLGAVKSWSEPVEDDEDYWYTLEKSHTCEKCGRQSLDWWDAFMPDILEARRTRDERAEALEQPDSSPTNLPSPPIDIDIPEPNQEIDTNMTTPTLDMSSSEDEKFALWLTWAIIGIKVLLAAFTVPHNATALQIESFWSMPTLGLLVYELSFLAAGIAISHGIVKGKLQSIATWAVLVASVLFMIFNSILANYVHASEVSGVVLPDVLLFYRDWIVPGTPIVLGFILTFVGFFDPITIINRKQAMQKVEAKRQEVAAEVARAKAEQQKSMIGLRMETVKAQMAASAAEIKLQAKSAMLKAEAAIERQKIEVETNVKKAIAKLGGEKMASLIESDAFSKKIDRAVKEQVAGFIAEYIGENEDNPNG